MHCVRKKKKKYYIKPRHCKGYDGSVFYDKKIGFYFLMILANIFIKKKY